MNRKIEVFYENKPCYNIIVRFNFDNLLENIIKISGDKPRKIAIVTDSNVEKIYLDEVANILREKYNHILTHTIKAGEENKTLANIRLLYEDLIKNNFYRGDLLIALGGGVIGDMVGFAAATYLRGIDFVQIPTSLLSQVDSSIGGKTGVDFDSYKNMVGAFHMPKLVYINTSVLNTLPNDQFSSGMAEIIKHGIIRDRQYFEWLNDNYQSIMDKTPEALMTMIARSCEIKRDVVQIDPTEKGIRAHLNFGHTIGHAVEKLSDFKLSHGQSVALGIVAASAISNRQNYISDADFNTIVECLKRFGLDTKTDISSADEVLFATKSDKKMTDKGIRFILIKSIGESFIKEGLDDEILLEAIRGIACG